ncbi:endonuclease/exonuclease/phosphatase family protein [Pedobacter sp. ASV1-7]|uniref:endonuclease/exonuclease/phosphatase family protein n=1 Tax=Pedobacter sp. ASV1-7 TaxID=3145237 RepID=UPI0032E857EB
MMKKRILNLIALIAVLPILACSKGGSDKGDITPPPTGSTADLKIMTYNVHHCSPPTKDRTFIDLNAIASVINIADPDIVALQEVDVHTLRSGTGNDQAKLLGSLTGRHSYFAKAIDYEGGEFGVAILSKYPILSSSTVLLPHKDGVDYEQRSMAVVKVKLPNGKEVIVASTHWDAEAHRLLQAQKIADYFQNETLPVIVGGDYNDQPGSTSINYFDQFFKRTCTTGCAPSAPSDAPTKAIDLIFYKSNDLTVLTHQVINNSYASDHRPVVATFKFK